MFFFTLSAIYSSDISPPQIKLVIGQRPHDKDQLYGVALGWLKCRGLWDGWRPGVHAYFCLSPVGPA
uniref:Uncharacterized protein n=1 Tax=Anguilla anguilla TaxID=7936 RepID=A0A0E9XQA3_ANGAN